ncbi:MAG: TraE family protein, partial [Intestinimonas sp.]|nr:TraE family protein [Intestinimonas sp.]
WKRLRKLGGMMTLITQNVEECLRSDTARLMFANSEFLVMLNQAPTDRVEPARLLHISDTQLSYITNADVGCGLVKVGGSIVPFQNEFPRDTELYRLMSTTPNEKF